MGDYNELVSICKHLLFERFAPAPAYIRGLLGDGQGNVLVPDRPDYNYARFNRSSTDVFEIFNKEVSQPIDNLPILIGEYPWQPGLTQVVGIDWATYNQIGWGNTYANLQAHASTHEWPDLSPGSDYTRTFLRSIVPLQGYGAGSGTSYNFYAQPYEYDYTGTSQYWPGLPPISLAGALPATGTMRYMGVYLNPATNQLGAVSGSAVAYVDNSEPPRPKFPLNVYPVAYARLYGGQQFIAERDTRDARRLWNNTLIFTGTSSEGGGGSWPFASIWTISTTDPDADFPDIATAIASGLVGLRDGLVLDAESFSSASSTDLSLLIMTLSGGLGQPEVTSSVSNDFTLKISNAGVVLRYLQVAHTAAGTLSGCIKSNQDGSIYDHLKFVKTSGAATTAVGIYIYGGNSSGHIIQDCDISIAAGTTKYGVLVDTAASTVVIEGGQITAATADIRVNHASATVTLKGPQLKGGGLSVAAGTVRGDYYDSSGVHYFVDTSVSATPIIIGAGVVDLNGLADALVIDADADTTISSPTDDQIDIEIGGADKATFTADLLKLANSTHFSSDTTAQRVKNTCGSTVTPGWIGYVIWVTGSGFEFKVDTTAGIDPKPAVAVVVGGANNADIVVTPIGRHSLLYGGSAPAAGDFLIPNTTGAVLKQTSFTPDVIAVAMGAGDGTNVDAILLGLTQLARLPNGFAGQTTNYKIATSVASNDLTVALKTLAGSDPTPTDRITARIGDTVYDITAALSVTALDATNWCNLGAAETAAKDIDLFCYLIAETGASAGVKIGFSRIPYAYQMGDFTNTTTNEKYIKGNWTNFNTTDKVEVIGRFNATLSAGAGYTWTIPATSIILNRPIFETRWLTYGGVVTSSTGTITTVGTTTTVFQVAGRNLNINHDTVITTNGTGAGVLQITIPFTGVRVAILVGKEIVTTNDALTGRMAAGNFVGWVFYTGNYPAVDGSRIVGTGSIALV